MSTKKRHLYDMAWHALVACCLAKREPVTAGEFAKHMGIARGTAQRWLADMMAENAVLSYAGIGKNHLPKFVFEPCGINYETETAAYAVHVVRS